jgi:hypothetical protein
MAQMIAGRLKGGAAGGPPAQGAVQPVAAGSEATRAPGQNGPGGGQRGDLSQMLQRAPVLQLADLHKGDAVMIVSTDSASDSATAITLLAGVEPMLQASTKASQSLFSTSWSLGGGGDAAAASQQ